ncbi:MAG: tetratricopeptide repeat protein, partial [Planctomycetota bacterium]
MKEDLDYGLQAMMVVESEKTVDWKLEQYQDALAKESGNAGLHSGIAQLYVKSGQMEKSQEHIDKALELDKHQRDMLLDIILPLAQKKDYETAKFMVRRY